MSKFFFKCVFLFLVFPTLFPLVDLRAQAQESVPAYQAGSWISTGGPLGGMGYDIRLNPQDPAVMFVTDAFTGIFRSDDGGASWYASNAGIRERGGASGDVIAVFCTTIDPNNPDIIWLGMQDFGALYRSQDGGHNWERRANGIRERSGFTLRGIAVEPGNSDVVYAAGEISSWTWAGESRWGREFDLTMGVVYKTVNAGKNWQAIWHGDNLARYVLIDPTNVSTVYVSTGIFDREAANSDFAAHNAGGVGILKSTDGGKTWTQVNNGLRNLYVGSLFMHPQNPQILLAGVGNNTYLYGGGIYLTENGGESWSYVGGSHVTSVEFAASNPNIAYAADADQFYRSEDGGHTWRELQRANNLRWGPDGIRVGVPIDFQVDPRDPMRIFVNNYGGGNFLSTDGGSTWVTASTGYTGSDLDGLTLDPAHPSLVFVNGRSGPYRSQDGGMTWTGINPIASGLPEIAEGARIVVDPSDSTHVLMSSAHWGWTYESRDTGDTWALRTQYFDTLMNLPYPHTNQKFQGPQAIAFAPSNPQRVYQGWGVSGCVNNASEPMCQTKTLLNLLISDDSGKTWHKPEQPAAAPVMRIVRSGGSVNLRSGPGTNYAIVGTSNPGNELEVVSEQPDWYEIKIADTTAWINASLTVEGSGTSGSLPPFSVSDIVVHPQDENKLWAAVVGQGVFVSSDGGSSWRKTGTAINNLYVMDLVLDPQNVSILYAATAGHGIFKSEDGGVTWRLASSGMDPNEHAVAVVVDPIRSNIIYAATWQSGVYVSDNSGASWHSLNQGLTVRWSKGLALSADGSVLYLTTRGGGVFRLGTPS